ncbi:MAG TPA: GNAT family N-acetyltransferase [Phnomibacter sp.]|nr:GNAT family N-acetyltransferase [Phnomibacter sp.]
MVQVTHNSQAQQFEVSLPDGGLATMVYRHYKGNIAFMHTHVPEAYEGQGIAAAMAQKALQWVQSQGKKIMLYCPYVSGYVKRHPEYHPLVNMEYHQGWPGHTAP